MKLAIIYFSFLFTVTGEHFNGQRYPGDGHTGDHVYPRIGLSGYDDQPSIFSKLDLGNNGPHIDVWDQLQNSEI